MKKALLIVDMLNDFAKEGGALYINGAEDLAKNIEELKQHTYGSGGIVVYINDAHEKDDKEFGRYGPHAVKGTYGAQVIDELKPTEKDSVVEKKRFSGFLNTNLDEILRKEDVSEVVVAGLATEICDMVTSIDAVMRDYAVTIVADAVKPLNPEGQQAAYTLYKILGIQTATTKEVLETR